MAESYTLLRSRPIDGAVNTHGRPLDNRVRLFVSALEPAVQGNGYLAGEFPDGITTVEGVPVSATIRILVRQPGYSLDGAVIAEVQSAQDGTWRVDNLALNRRYDVIARHDGLNDVIMSDVTPAED